MELITNKAIGGIISNRGYNDHNALRQEIGLAPWSLLPEVTEVDDKNYQENPWVTEQAYKVGVIWLWFTTR